MGVRGVLSWVVGNTSTCRADLTATAATAATTATTPQRARHLVFDGLGLSRHLLAEQKDPSVWLYGGDYARVGAAAQSLFTKLAKHGVHSHVYIDGWVPVDKEPCASLRRSRSLDVANKTAKWLNTQDNVPLHSLANSWTIRRGAGGRNSRAIVAPMLLAEMLMTSLRDIPMVECHVCHGEADNAIVSKCVSIQEMDSNAFCCVVSSDSDFMLDSNVPAVAFFNHLDVHVSSTQEASGVACVDTNGDGGGIVSAAVDMSDVVEKVEDDVIIVADDVEPRRSQTDQQEGEPVEYDLAPMRSAADRRKPSTQMNKPIWTRTRKTVIVDEEEDDYVIVRYYTPQHIARQMGNLEVLDLAYIAGILGHDTSPDDLVDRTREALVKLSGTPNFGVNRGNKNQQQASGGKQRSMRNLSGTEFVNIAARCVRAHRADVLHNRDETAMASFAMDLSQDEPSSPNPLSVPHQIAQSICRTLFPTDINTRSRLTIEMYNALDMYARIAPPPQYVNVSSTTNGSIPLTAGLNPAGLHALAIGSLPSTLAGLLVTDMFWWPRPCVDGIEGASLALDDAASLGVCPPVSYVLAPLMNDLLINVAPQARQMWCIQDEDGVGNETLVSANDGVLTSSSVTVVYGPDEKRLRWTGENVEVSLLRESVEVGISISSLECVDHQTVENDDDAAMHELLSLVCERAMDEWGTTTRATDLWALVACIYTSSNGWILADRAMRTVHKADGDRLLAAVALGNLLQAAAMLSDCLRVEVRNDDDAKMINDTTEASSHQPARVSFRCAQLFEGSRLVLLAHVLAIDEQACEWTGDPSLPPIDVLSRLLSSESGMWIDGGIPDVDRHLSAADLGDLIERIVPSSKAH